MSAGTGSRAGFLMPLAPINECLEWWRLQTKDLSSSANVSNLWAVAERRLHGIIGANEGPRNL